MHRGGGVGAVGGSTAPGYRTPPAAYDGKIAGLYDLEQTLGAGHFAVVKLARHVFTGEKVAVKVIDKSKLDEVSRAHLFQEVRCMKLVQHPNVVRLYEVIDTQTKLYLILELGDGGDLYDYIMKHESGLSESLAKDYFRQIVRAISYCHRLHVVHRDLKPENVVFFERLGVVKLTDFGFSNKFCPGQKLETSCGSLAYSAPEILLGDSYDAPAVDVWSLGVILFMLVCGQAPFQEANDSETLIMIMDCKYTIPNYVSPGCRRLISRMLVREPDRRATLPEIAADPWLSDDNISEEFDAPLVSRQQLTGDDHALIIQKMVNGKIATKDQILDALEKNAYNHITATYYLLAERKLRSQRGDQQTKTKRCAEVCNIGRTFGVAALLQPPTAGASIDCVRTPGDGAPRARKCSIVREDDEVDEDEEEENAGDGTHSTSGTCGEIRAPDRRPSRSEGRLDLALQARLARASPPPPAHIKVNLDDENTRARLGEIGIGHVASWMPFKKVMRPITATPTRTIPSYPIISITDTDGQPGKLPLLTEDEALPSNANGGPHQVAPNRLSRSSSEASEDESEGRKKRPAPPAARAREPPRPRRDSHDDSSDSGGRGASGGGGGTAAGGGTTSAPRTASAPRATAPPRRRRRGPRKETRLRESRSLNRISETAETVVGHSMSNTVSIERPEEGRRRWLAALMGRARSLGPGAGGGALLRLVAGRGAPLAPLAPLAVCRLHVGDASKCCGLC